MSVGQLWETRPLEFWAKAKELRAGWQDSVSSRENIVGHGQSYFADWQMAFPAIRYVEDNPIGAMLANKAPVFARKARLACEVRGWGREICGYQGTCWGAQFLGYQGDGSTFSRRKFVVPFSCVCDQHAKRGQQVRDFENVPQWMADTCMYLGPRVEEREKAMNEHRVYCILRNLNDLERIFGQECDDEMLMKLVRNYELVRDYAKEVSYYMTFKPSPLSVKDLFSVYTIGGPTNIDSDETVKFWKLVCDEIKWRAENQIAAVGNERFRWMEAHPPSWHFLKYYRYMEQYGAVCIGSQYSHSMSGILEYKPDGSIDRRHRMMYPEDTPITTREDAVRYMEGPDAREPYGMKTDEIIRRDGICEFAKIFQADGALLGIWRHGLGCTLTRKEQAMYLRKAGLSVMHYEGSQPGDRTDLDEKRFLDQLDSWMQSLGLRRLEE